MDTRPTAVSWLLLYIAFVALLHQIFFLFHLTFFALNLCLLDFYEELTFREKQLTAQRFLVFPCCLKNPKIKVITLHQTRLISAACYCCGRSYYCFFFSFFFIRANLQSALRDACLSVRSPPARQLVAFIAFSMKNDFFTCLILRSVLTSPPAST